MSLDAEYQKRTMQLRKSVKAGDKVAGGLVIEVKGSLVKVQTYERRCETVMEYSNPRLTPDCVKWKTVAAGEQWVRKDELFPPK